jgi:hypothetical protein
MVLPVTNVQQVFQDAVLHASILLSSFEELLSVLDPPQVELVGMLRSKGSSDCLAYDMFCGGGAASSKKRISIEVSVSVEDAGICHRIWL